jgi:hypothetical protein
MTPKSYELLSKIKAFGSKALPIEKKHSYSQKGVNLKIRTSILNTY